MITRHIDRLARKGFVFVRTSRVAALVFERCVDADVHATIRPYRDGWLITLA